MNKQIETQLLQQNKIQIYKYAHRGGKGGGRDTEHSRWPLQIIYYMAVWIHCIHDIVHWWNIRSSSNSHNETLEFWYLLDVIHHLFCFPTDSLSEGQQYF